MSNDAQPRSPPEAAVLDPVDQIVGHVRYRVFRAVRLYGTLLGLPNGALLLYLGMKSGGPGGATIASLVAEGALISVPWFFTERTHRAGAASIVLLAALLAGVSLYALGLTPGNALLLGWVCVGCAAFYGRRVALTAFSGMVLLVVAYGFILQRWGGAAEWRLSALAPSTPLFVRYATGSLALMGILLATVLSIVEGLEESTRELTGALDRERAEREARQAGEERFRTMSSIGTEGIMVHSEGRVLDANLAFARIVGCETADALVGRAGFEVIPLTPASKERVQEHMRTGSTETYDVELLRPDGGIVPAETSGRAIVYRGEKARLVSMRDVTQRKGAEAERARLEAILRQSQKMESIGQLAGGLAHDFNNSLGVILSCAEDLVEVVPENRRADVAAILDAARSSAGLTRSLLAFARKEPSVARPVDVADLLRSLVEMLRRTLPKSITVAVQGADGGRMPVVLGDRSEIEHALLNLALNARDAMPKGGTLTLSWQVQVLEAGDMAELPGMRPGPAVRIDVADDGTGIAPEILPRIFEPLFTTKPADKGTGLGLSSVYGVIRGHRGHIQVHTELGRGTRFSVLLPAAPEGSATAFPIRSRPGVAIVADDNPAERVVARRTALALFESVLEAADAREALEHIERRDGLVAALIADHDMPGMTGAELVDVVRRRWPAVPAVVMSGLHRDIVGWHVLRKPFSLDDLDAALSTSRER